MGIRFNRHGMIAPGKRAEAVAFSAEVSAYFTQNWGVPLTWGMEVGGAWGTVHWFAEYDSLAQFEEIAAKSLADEGMAALMDKGADLFLAGSFKDTLVMTM